jgi:mannose-6-phosphate isomerase-like protein (cupin superfamily)
MSSYHIEQLDEIPAHACPCGQARRAFAELAGSPISVHMVEIADEARAHYHKRMTETYVILEGEGHLELDGELIPVRPWTTVQIRPGCRHRAVGRLKILNIPAPAFDPTDEWFD